MGLYIFSFDAEPTSVRDNNDFLGNIEIYPNPVSDQLNLLLFGINSQNVEINIFDIQGKIVLEEELKMNGLDVNKEYDLSRFGNGQYTLRILVDGQTESRNFTILH